MGGSALTQLKNQLRESGLSRTSNPKDQKKRNKKNLSSGSQAHRSAKLEAIGKEFNRFDTREEKNKFEVVTRGGKLEMGKKGAPGKSRAAGVELRKETLLPLLQQRNHTSTFIDRRFGENSSTLTPEEKALERFTAERQSRLSSSSAASAAPRSSKRAKFNLEDGDDAGDDDFLTHGGTKLGFGDEEELDAGGWGGLGSAVEGGATSGNREPLLRRRMAAAAGDADEEGDEPLRKKSKAEVMEEVISKSKAYKHERQKIRSEDDETRHALDAELKDLRMLLAGGGGSAARVVKEVDGKGKVKGKEVEEVGEGDEDDEDEEEEDEDDDEEGDADEDEDEDEDEDDEEEALDDDQLEAALSAAGKSGVDRDLLRKLIGGSSDSDSDTEDDPPLAFDPTLNSDHPRPPLAQTKDESDQYDQYVRLLALEPRAHASDRLKTPLELAQDAAKELREREEKRLKRQRGEDDASDEEEEGGKGKGKGKKSRKPQGDDLDDGYLEEGFGEADGEEEMGEGGLGKGLEEGVALGGDEEDEEDEDEEDDEEEEEDDEEDDLGESEPEEDIDTTAPEPLVAPPVPLPSDPKSRQWGGKDLAPPELPFTFPCPSTHAEFANLLSTSRVKEEDTAVVVKRIRTLYHPGLGEGNKAKLQVFTHVLLDHIIFLASSPNSSTTFTTINSLLPSLLTLSHAYPLASAPYYVLKLSLMQKNFIRGVLSDPLNPSSLTFPGPAELTLLRLIGIIWSTSDLSHPVAAPALLLIGQYLNQSRIRNVKDVASGLFLVSLVEQYEKDSKRLVPEAINFLGNALLLLLPNKWSPRETPVSFPMPDVGQSHTKSLKLKVATAMKNDLAPAKLNFLETLTSADVTDQRKVDLVATTLTLVKDFAEMYVSFDAFIELFGPFEGILAKVQVQHLPSAVETQIADLRTNLQRMLKLSLSSRKPLLLQHHKPIPIATFIPKFDEGFNPNSKFDPDTERAEANKLRSLYKKEKKGAVRELRKDNKFLANEAQKAKKVKDAEYDAKIRRIMGSLQDERAEEKQHLRAKDKGKKQDKRRAGRN